MNQYIVKSADETVENVDILGDVRKVGDIVELEAEAAAPLVEEGKLEFKGECSGGGGGHPEGDSANTALQPEAAPAPTGDNAPGGEATA